MRENFKSSTSASVRISIVLPRPGTPSSRACPPLMMHINTCCTTVCWPTITLPTSPRIA